ncbi:MAG: hypothetical protein Ct9H300mP28_34150 [Pseudomonadota bacterium]|nr:MAG: hypothetical protein Ct9H300mP28_34150 [Pseudomonadota bacterium]
MDGNNFNSCRDHAFCPIGLGAARNLAPKYIYLFNRSIIALSRTFPEIILAIFAVKLFGFGLLQDSLLLSIGTIGFYAKFLAEDIENMSESQAEAIKATVLHGFNGSTTRFNPRSCQG